MYPAYPLCILMHSVECTFVISYLSQFAVFHAEPQALSVGQGVASLGSGGLAGRGGRAVAHWSPSGHYHLTACLVFIQRTLTCINYPVRGGKGW